MWRIFLDPEVGSQTATLVVVVVVLVVISSLKIPFLTRSEAQRIFAYTFIPLTLPTYIYRLRFLN